MPPSGAGFGFDLVEGFDWATALYGVDDRKDDGEVREVALGLIDDLVFTVVFTLRADEIRIISARRANRKERARYAET